MQIRETVEKGEPVGECPEHGFIKGNELDWKFPVISECAVCGREVTMAGIAEREMDMTFYKEQK